MKKHVKIYLDFFGYDQSSWIPCEMCGQTAVDIHHIEARSMGGSKTKDTIENLQALCRKCHMELGDKKEWKRWLQTVHNQKIELRLEQLKNKVSTK
jgi:5-methylcytosine-specific restriction endonuclease McrA